MMVCFAVVRVGQAGGNVHLESLQVGDHCIRQLQHRVALLFVGLCQRGTKTGRLEQLPLVREGILLCPSCCSKERV